MIAHGFDPYIGIFHSVVYGRPSLALDLVEELRHPLVDRLALNLFNNEILTAEDFRPVEGEGIYLTPDALKTFFKWYEQRMREPFTLKESNEQTHYRDVIKKQIQNLSKKIQFNEAYKPFRLWE